MVLVRRKKVVFKDLPDLNALPKPTDAMSTPSSSTSLLPPIPTLDANGQPVGDKSAKQLAKEADPDVFYIKQTGEIFLDYEYVQPVIHPFIHPTVPRRLHLARQSLPAPRSTADRPRRVSETSASEQSLTTARMSSVTIKIGRASCRERV